MKKYLIVPGSVKSAYDGVEHYLGFAHLCRLYQVRPELCVNADTLPGPLLAKARTKLIVLGPLEQGNYVEYLREIEGRLQG